MSYFEMRTTSILLSLVYIGTSILQADADQFSRLRVSSSNVIGVAQKSDSRELNQNGNQTANQDSTEKDVRCTLEIVQTDQEYKLGGEINFVLRLKNISTTDVRVWGNDSPQTYRFHVVSPKGEIVPEIEGSLEISGRRMRVLRPNQELNVPVRFSRRYNFTEKGAYTIIATTNVPSEKKQDGKMEFEVVKSAPAKIVIVEVVRNLD
jgi:hypothetical protein